MKKNCLILLLILSTIVLGKSFEGCQYGEITIYDKKTKNLKCQDCPAGCGICSTDGEGHYVCENCKMGYFAKADGTCQRCAAFCDFCSGPSMSQCTATSRGYIYSRKLKRIIGCPSGCKKCNQDMECLKCKVGHLATPIARRGKGRSIFKCQLCKEANCEVCVTKQVPVLKVNIEVCDTCTTGYGPALFNKICRRCSGNCAECSRDHSKCHRCNEGYRLDLQTSKCQKMPIENCSQFDITTNGCSKCNTYHVLSENSKKCISCLDVTNGCVKCRLDYQSGGMGKSAVNPLYKGKVYCASCANGLKRNFQTGGCDELIPNCLQERSSRGKKVCVECIPNYYFNEKEMKCDLIPESQKIEGCIAYDSIDPKTCELCDDGYFQLESSRCQKCHPSCVTCGGERANQCTECPVEKMIYRVEHRRRRFHHSAKYRCVDNCSDLNSQGLKFKRKGGSRYCVQDKNQSQEIIVEGDYSFHRMERNGRYNLIREVTLFFKDYKGYVKADRKKAVLAEKLKASGYDKFCFYRGHLKERLSEDRETVYECNCNDGAYGAHCHISEPLFLSSNRFLKKTLKDVSLIFNS